MNALLTILADPKFSNDLQAFNNPDQVFLPRRFRPFTQPREPRSVSIVVDRDQRLQSGNCLVFQAVNEALVPRFRARARAARPIFSKVTDAGSKMLRLRK